MWATVIPMGTTWELALETRPTIGLFTSDGSHPNALGTLLTACVFVKAITGELPENLPGTFMITDEAGESVRLLGADPLDAEFCIRITKEVMSK